MSQQVFSDFTWADLPPTGLVRRNDLTWEKSHALAVEAHRSTSEFCSLNFEQWRALVSATHNGLPIVLTTVDREGRRTRRTVIVDHIMSLSSGTYANLYIRGWGMAWPVGLKYVVAVEVPETEFALDPEPHPAMCERCELDIDPTPSGLCTECEALEMDERVRETRERVEDSRHE